MIADEVFGALVALREEIDSRLDQLRPDRYSADDLAWAKPVIPQLVAGLDRIASRWSLDFVEVESAYHSLLEIESLDSPGDLG